AILRISLDPRFVAGERQSGAGNRLSVRIGDVMHQLAHRPTAIAIRRVELAVIELVYSGAELRGQGGDRGDLGGDQDGVELSRPRELACRKLLAVVQRTLPAMDCSGETFQDSHTAAATGI